MKRTIQALSAMLAIALVLCAPVVALEATSRPTPGFNLFSVEQDIEIGRQSAVEAERQLSLLNDRNVDRYLNEIIRKLAAQAPSARYPYAVKAVNASEINAFALPGGPLYVNRGLFEAARRRSEAELAGVLAHEMSHVAQRHGTHQAYAADPGYAVSIAPDGGVVDTGNGQQAMLYGVIVNHYEPFEGETERQRASRELHYAPFEDTDRWRGSLSDATDDLVRQIIRSNSYLSAEYGSARQEEIDGASSFSVVLSGRSPVTGQEETVTVVTRSLSSDGHVLYVLCIVPGSGYDSMAQTFARMLRTLNVNDDAAHRAMQTSSR